MSIKIPFAIPFGASERSALDLPVAALAGLAVAFAMFTIPDDLLAEAVGATGIGGLITAAQPPLGSTARIILALAGAVTAFGGAFFLLRWLDRFAQRGAVAAPAVIEAEAPRIRKSDAHPDAPPCRPISASRDLGEPATSTISAPEPAAWPEEVAPIVPADRDPRPSAVLNSAPEAGSATSESLSDLMARLERGLARRDRAAAQASAASAKAVPEPVAAPAAPLPSPSNDRLQSAMDGLRALAARG